MRRSHVAISFLAALTVATVPVMSQEKTERAESMRTIRVTGEGKASAAPDMAMIQCGVTTEAATAAEALTANNKAMERVITVLKDAKISAKDIQTSQFNVQPVYRPDPQNRNHPPEITAYRVTNQVRVRVRELPALGKVLDALVQAGSNQLSGVSFDVAEPSVVLDLARGRAIDDASRRAKIYATAAHVRVGKVLTISEYTLTPPQPMYLGRAASLDAGAVPVAAGENEFHVQINVVFELTDGA